MLIGVGEEVGGDGFRLAEIKAGVSNIFEFTTRDTVAFHRQIPLGEDLQLVLAHVALVTVEVEIDVIGHVHRAGLVHGGAIGNRDAVIVGQTIVRGGLQSAGEALIAIGRGQSEQHFLLVGADNAPAALIKPFRAAVSWWPASFDGVTLTSWPSSGKRLLPIRLA